MGVWVYTSIRYGLAWLLRSAIQRTVFRYGIQRRAKREDVKEDQGWKECFSKFRGCGGRECGGGGG